MFDLRPASDQILPTYLQYLEHGSSQLFTMECLGIVGIVGILTASGWRRWEILESEWGGIADIIPEVDTPRFYVHDKLNQPTLRSFTDYVGIFVFCCTSPDPMVEEDER